MRAGGSWHNPPSDRPQGPGAFDAAAGAGSEGTVGGEGTQSSSFVRTGIAFASLGAAAIHFSTSGEHGALFGAAFLAMGTFQAAWAFAMVLSPGRLVLLAGLAGNAAIIAVWLTSHTSGLPFGPGAGQPEAIGFKDLTATGLEVLVVAGATALLHPRTGPRLRAASLPGGLTGAAALLAALLAGAAVATPHAHGPHAHDGEEGHAHADTAAATEEEHGAHGHGGGTAAHADADGHMHEGEHARRSGAAGGHDRAGDRSLASAHEDGGHGNGQPHAFEHNATAPAPDEHAHRERGNGGEPHEPGGRDHGHGRTRDHGGTREHDDGGHGGGHADPGGGHGHGGGGGSEDPPDGVAFEAARPGRDGEPGTGHAVVFRGQPADGEGPGHHGDEGPCSPTPEQEAAADKLYRDTSAVLARYENQPHLAFADGFDYAFGPTDRYFHMVSRSRLYDDKILEPAAIESFLYTWTDRGLVAIGGMYIMPKHGMPGPEIGGCRTKWHHHAGLGGRLASAGTMEQTPEMLHVWTYPGLDPYGHYDGRHISQLWAPGRHVPSVCRQSGDASDVCFP